MDSRDERPLPCGECFVCAWQHAETRGTLIASWLAAAFVIGVVSGVVAGMAVHLG